MKRSSRAESRSSELSLSDKLRQHCFRPATPATASEAEGSIEAISYSDVLARVCMSAGYSYVESKNANSLRPKKKRLTNG